MTGFASVSGMHDGTEWICEIRSVNNKGLDIRLRVPDFIQAYETDLKKQISECLSRGSLQVSFKVGSSSKDDQLTIDPDRLDWWFDQISVVEKAAKGKSIALRAVTAFDILNARPSVFSQTTESNFGDWKSVALNALKETLVALQSMRQTEGQALLTVLNNALDQIDNLVGQATTILSVRADKFHANLRAALDRLQTVAVDETRLEQEMAILAVKSDVTEELDRLKVHVAAARELFQNEAPIGRKFEFLVQEFNREANTLCSKSSHSDLTTIGLELKSVIDQMREQALNVE